MIGVWVIKVYGNNIVLSNISYGKGEVHSVINIDRNSIALCTIDGLEVYNKQTQQLTYKIPTHYKPSEAYSVLAQPIPGISNTKFLLWRSKEYFALINLRKKTMTPL